MHAGGCTSEAFRAQPKREKEETTKCRIRPTEEGTSLPSNWPNSVQGGGAELWSHLGRDVTRAQLCLHVRVVQL